MEVMMALIAKYPVLASILVTTIVTLFFPLRASCAPPEALEVLCDFVPGVVMLPASQLSGPVGAAISPVSNVYPILQAFGVQEVTRAFPGFDLADTLAVARTGEIVHQTDWSKVFRLRLREGSKARALCRALKESRSVLSADPNELGVGFSGPVYPNDTFFVDRTQWGVWNSGQSGGKLDADIDAPEGWGYTTGYTGFVPHRIAIVDEGFDGTHQELFGRAIGTLPPDTTSHGFQVACLAGANADNAFGIAGIDWHAELVSLLGGSLKSDNVNIQAIQSSWNPYHAEVINNSWGVPSFSNAVRKALADAYNRNQVAVCAMGNTGDSVPQYPAAYGQGIIAVGATTRRDSIWVSSSRGSHMDVCAPGHEIVSCTSDGGFRTQSGTSFAAPIVSGLASLLIAKNPSLYNDDVENLIKVGADDLGAPGFDPLYGMGRVNVRRTLQLLNSPNKFAQGADSGSGVYIQASGFYSGMEVLGVPGVADGYYDVKWYEVRKRVGFNAGFTSIPRVWGRGVRSKGYAGINQILVGMGWCGVEAGTITPDSCTLRTFVYEIPTGGTLHPTAPANAVFGWSALQVAQSPDSTQSFFVPQCDSSGVVVEGRLAWRHFFTCPDLDGGVVLKYKSRVKVVVKDSSGSGIAGIPTADIFVLLNGGTQVQGFIGEGADSIIANSRLNPTDNCPDLRIIPADGPTDASGTTYITFIGAGGQRDSTRKWGHYDSEMPVYVLGTKLSGRAYTDSAGVPYTLKIRNTDIAGGLFALPNQGEMVTVPDHNYMNAHIEPNPYDYWADFDESGRVTNPTDWNMWVAHFNHRCRTPNVH